MWVCIFLTASRTFGAELNGSKSDDSSGTIWGDGHEHVVLVKITHVTRFTDPKTGRHLVNYSADVLFDMDGSLAKKVIAMSGLLDAGSWGGADLKKDDVSAVHIKPGEKSDVFTCMPEMFL
ncbi:MAG TPA: hypothetical protein VKK61_01795, partial [Tepidisphaeraceae bacterium]|nr:hypothetical protein [Tepidisphaeraceae bacterium]